MLSKTAWILQHAAKHNILYIYILDTNTDNERTVFLKVYVYNTEYYLITETNWDRRFDIDTEFGKT